METLYEMALATSLRHDFEGRAAHEGRPLTDEEVISEAQWQLVENIAFLNSEKERKKATKEMRRLLREVDKRKSGNV